MTKVFLGQALLCGFLLLPSLSAESISKEDRIPINNVGRIVVDGRNLAEARLGVNIVTTSMTIKSWEGEDLAIVQKGHRSLGRITPLTVDHTRNGDEATLSLSWDHRFGIGIRIGRVDMTLLVPEAWGGELVLQDFHLKTHVEGLSIGALTGNMKLADLKITDSEIETVDLSMGVDSDFEAENVRAESWFLRGKLGKITARNIRGTIDAETIDGNISIDFLDFRGMSRLSSKLGKIAVFLPAESELELNLSSTLESVRTDLPVIGLAAEKDPHKIEGYIGSSDHHLTAHSGDGRVSVFSK